MNNRGVQVIETDYNGYRFRSRIEARWAIFFDACGLVWNYESEGFKLRNDNWFLPDFEILNLRNKNNDRVWVEVKVNPLEEDLEKIKEFAFDENGKNQIPILVLRYLPKSFKNKEDLKWMCDESKGTYFYNFITINGENTTAIPCITKKGFFELVTPDEADKIDFEKTNRAYNIAKSARFEHGETPEVLSLVEVKEDKRKIKEDIKEEKLILGGILKEFMEDMCIPDPGNRQNTKELYEIYVDYCYYKCVNPIIKKTFFKILIANGYRRDKNKHNFLDITIRRRNSKKRKIKGE